MLSDFELSFITNLENKRQNLTYVPKTLEQCKYVIMLQNYTNNRYFRILFADITEIKNKISPHKQYMYFKFCVILSILHPPNNDLGILGRKPISSLALKRKELLILFS